MAPTILRGVVAPAAAALGLLGCAEATAPTAAAPEGGAPAFLAVTGDGAEVSGESLQGQVTIIDFWAVF